MKDVFTLERKVKIPADRHISLNWDFEVPETVPEGEVSVILKFPAEDSNPPKTRESMLAAVNALCGMFAGTEHPGSYLERHHAENCLNSEVFVHPIRPLPPLMGIAKGSSFTVERLLEERRGDMKELE